MVSTGLQARNTPKCLISDPLGHYEVIWYPDSLLAIVLYLRVYSIH
jgi:hypothetical protein